MIATGFDHVRTDRSTPAAAPMQTPVDMTAYSSQARSLEPAASVVQPRATITRRPSLEMPLATPRPWPSGQTTCRWPHRRAREFDLNLDLDVPAFLRRNEG